MEPAGSKAGPIALPSWNAGNLSRLRGRPFRIRGQLLFDADHLPCRKGKPVVSNPARISRWEIHPIYSGDVCAAIDPDRCRAGDGWLWTPLNEWVMRNR